MAGADEFPLMRLTRKLGAVIDITRTIDRNVDDGVHHKEGGEIAYVFDTNVVQMFLEPYKNPRFGQIFQSPVWGGANRDYAELNAQSCLLAAEYLMSGALPGQRHGRWYMTAKHHQETTQQINYLALWGKEVAARLRNDEKFGQFALSRLMELNTVLSLDPSGDPSPFLELASRQGLSEASVARRRRLPSDQFRDWAIGVRSRETCRLLAQDRILEPADQVVRYASRRIAGKFMELEAMLRLTDQAREEIRTESEIWRREISKLPQNRESKTKSTQALTNDCEALALVSWGNRQTEGWNRRIVFVTGDRTLLDACRQRYVRDPQQRFFFARPISHFAPLFNPTSAKSRIAREAAFKQLQEVLESATVPLNLGLLVSDPERRLRARDDFALRVELAPDGIVRSLRDFFPKSRDVQWVEEQEATLDKLVAELRGIELLMLEAYPRFIAERLNKERERFLKEAVEAGTAVLANAIDERFTSARAAGVQFSLQMMSDALQDFLKIAKDGQSSHRAMIQVRLSFSEDSESYLDYASTVAWLKAMDREELHTTLERLMAQPARTFALVALLAFNLEIWKDAERYADLAARAAEEGLAANTADNPRLSDEYYEFLYLKAKSLRFRLSDFRPEEGPSYTDVWWEWMTAAEKTLTRCIDHHRSEREYARQLRGLSERAALYLAYCEWFAFGNLAKLKPETVAIEAALNAFQKGVADLVACARLNDLPKVRARLQDTASNGAPGQIIIAAARQYNSNIFATLLTAKLLINLWPSQREAIEIEARKLPAPQVLDWPHSPPIVDAYAAAVEGRWDVVNDIPVDRLSLALDIDVVTGLQRLSTRW